jgi:hypothetical protein
MSLNNSLLALTLLCSGAVWAQEFRGTVLGRITDSSGAIVAGASVRVRNVDTNTSVSTKSNDIGAYQVPFLLPGNYDIQVEHAGFKKLDRQGLHISTNEQITLDLTLEVGASSESITVTAAAPQLNMANADLGQVIDNSYVGMTSVSLSRNVVNLRSLAPGVTGDTGTYTSSAQANFAIAGGGSGQGKNEIIVDGMPNTTAGGTIGFIPSVDSVEEVKVHTTMFDASYGHSNAGALSITTRGGTNELHGAFYGYKRWRDLNANSWTNNRLGLDKPPVGYHQWGYTAGGPVLIPKLYNGRNRTFFSTSLERDHDPRELTRQARVPTAAEKQGDFSQTLNRAGGAFSIFDPATTVVSGSTATRQAFAGAKIPASRTSPIGTAVLSKFPAPNQQSGAAQLAAYNWADSKTYTVDQRQVGARIDHILSDRQRLFGRIGFLNRLQLADDLFPGVLSYPVLGGTDLGSLIRHRVNFSVDDTLIVSPTLVGSIRLGALSYTSDTRGGAPGADPKTCRRPTLLSATRRFAAGPATTSAKTSRPSGPPRRSHGKWSIPGSPPGPSSAAATPPSSAPITASAAPTASLLERMPQGRSPWVRRLRNPIHSIAMPPTRPAPEWLPCLWARRTRATSATTRRLPFRTTTSACLCKTTSR